MVKGKKKCENRVFISVKKRCETFLSICKNANIHGQYVNVVFKGHDELQNTFLPYCKPYIS